MFIGHHAVAFAAKKFAPTTSLGTLVAAVQFLDMLWPPFLLLGLEHARIEPGITAVSPLDLYDYPFSHSLLASLLWSAIFGGLYFAIKRNARASLVVGIAVFSHWILDFVTHRPDMPLTFGNSTYVGLGLWNSLAGTLIVEASMFVVGIIIYLKATASKDRIGTYAWWSIVVFLLAMYLSSIFGPPPPDMNFIAIGGSIGVWLFVLWSWWIERHRKPVDKIR
jgi:membrane-bound metal-dependent hydrolase YbcI (DUF457 family)